MRRGRRETKLCALRVLCGDFKPLKNRDDKRDVYFSSPKVRLSPDNDVKNVSLTDLVGLEELQQIQDAFAAANDVASIISDIDGKPITRASNFCGVCEIIRSTEKGDINCRKSEKILGEKAKARMRPTYGQCLSCGFVDASAPIIVGSKHIANWRIGQSNAMRVDKNRIDIVIRGTGEFCEVRIADHDTGIPDEIKEHIFEENFVHGETGNTGLGLYIVRNAMESYGGSVYV